MQSDDVRALQQLGEQRKAHAERVFGVAAEPGDVVILDTHMERLGEACHLLADVAEPDDAEDLVLELVEHDRREIVIVPPPGGDMLDPSLAPTTIRIGGDAIGAVRCQLSDTLRTLGPIHCRTGMCHKRPSAYPQQTGRLCHTAAIYARTEN